MSGVVASGHVVVAREGPVLRLTLCRPNKKNALTGEMYDALTDALRGAEGDSTIGAVLMSGSGGAFCAGNDIADFLSASSSAAEAPSLRFVRAIASCKTPLVAAVEGVAIGVGTTLCLHCDLVYAAPSALFRMPFVDLGLVPEAASSLLLPQRIGLARASELLMLGDAFGAEQALRFGLVNAIVATEDLLAHALSRRSGWRLSRAALAATRRLIRGDTTRILPRLTLRPPNLRSRCARRKPAPLLQSLWPAPDRGKRSYDDAIPGRQNAVHYRCLARHWTRDRAARRPRRRQYCDRGQDQRAAPEIAGNDLFGGASD
jgi:enoyl-CoA hydratase/carnithine racemase